MPSTPNRFLRIVVPAALALVAVAASVAVFRNTASNTATPSGPASPSTPAAGSTPGVTTPQGTNAAPGGTIPAPSTGAAPSPAPAGEATGSGAAQASDLSSTAGQESDGEPANQPPASQPPPGNQQPGNQAAAVPAGSVIPLTGLRARQHAGDPLATDFAPLGSLQADTPLPGQLVFSRLGAGVKSYRLAHHFTSVKREQNLEVQHEYTLPIYDPSSAQPLADASGRPITANLVPFAAAAIEINSAVVPLMISEQATIWRQVAPDRPGAFEAIIENDQGQPVVRVERAYVLRPGSSVMKLEQRIFNLTPLPLAIRYFQFGPVDLEQGVEAYGGDKRRVRFGYLLKPSADPARNSVVSTEYLLPRSDVATGSTPKRAADAKLGTGLVPAITPDGRPYVDSGGYQVFEHPKERTIWPNDRSVENQYELSWVGLTNRYFGASIGPWFDPETRPSSKSLSTVQFVDRLMLSRLDGDGKGPSTMALRLTSPLYTLQAGTVADLSVSIFAGPLSRPDLRADPLAKATGLDGLVVFNFGGPCGPCTFPFLTGALFWLLHLLHDNILFDWALAVIVLVVIVRSCLHPVTRWSQIRIQRFGKQMQAMAPKQKKLQEKYANDPQAMRAEMAKLWREEGVNPAGMLGCVPMFLQMPVWIALYATLYFAVELRHQPALFGLFQTITNGKWLFLADLAEPDHAIPFGTSFRIPLLATIIGPISSLNVLPFVLGAVFFVHQKYLSPPTTATMTPEQELQMKMVKWMSVFLFPVFMYNAPSGLAIYFIANSTLAIFENKWIRRHIDKHDLLNVEKMKAQRKPGGGFMGRLMEAA
ncbi:MAG: membrane protein insertase YidC [Planctomycetota bacterium]|nr:membrane protein insertase YidC [Planctomycetota bacterium]